MHSLEVIERTNRDAAWREYRHALLAGDKHLARSIYWAELAGLVSTVLDPGGQEQCGRLARAFPIKTVAHPTDDALDSYVKATRQCIEHNLQARRGTTTTTRPTV